MDSSKTRSLSIVCSSRSRNASRPWASCVLLALLIWRLMERTMRTYIDTTGTPIDSCRDKKATERPTSFMMVTKFAGVIVLKWGDQRQLAHPLSVIQAAAVSDGARCACRLFHRGLTGG